MFKKIFRKKPKEEPKKKEDIKKIEKKEEPKKKETLKEEKKKEVVKEKKEIMQEVIETRLLTAEGWKRKFLKK